jgi:hypothetical protein
MAYVKISDPNIIDISAWQQVINVVNQHSDAISSLTNNFGATFTPPPAGTDWSYAFDLSSCLIYFGKGTMTLANTPTSRTEGGGFVYEETYSFPTPPFSITPVVTATIQSSSITTRNDDLSVTIFNVNSSGFSVRVLKAGGAALSGTSNTFYIHWIAIGPSS